MNYLALIIAALSLFFASGIYFTKSYQYRQYLIAQKSSMTRSYKVNINLANWREFDNLPGIGFVMAQRIIDYRNQHGRFDKVEDLLLVKGIGDKKFTKIRPYLTMEVY
jgi:comEA protein